MNAAVAGDLCTEPVMRLVTFRLHQESYGVDVMRVHEVLRVREIAPVPGAPSYVLGIVNLRGNVVTVIDTRARFGLPSTEIGESNRIVIIESDKQVLGMMVDGVAEVVEVPASKIDPTPGVGHEGSSRYIQGVVVQGDELLIIINIKLLLSEDEPGEIGMF